MAASRYFLIRRDNREFIGPMLIEDVRRRLDRMEIGLQDEISGHCGPWIVLDQKEELTLHYPDVAGMLGDNLPLSWRETTGHARVISRQDSRKEKRRKSSPQAQAKSGFNEYLKQRKRRSRNMGIAAAGLVVLAVVASTLILSRKDEIPPVADIASLAAKDDPTEFLNVMGIKIIPLAPKIVKSQKSQTSWLPWLRMYAFFTTGAIEGVPNKILRGEIPASSPQDCSVDAWKRKWREGAGQTAQFVQGKSLPRNPWTKILSMDPGWIKRRPARGWVKPRNYSEGCLMTASLAIRSLAGEPGLGAAPEDGLTPEILAAVSRRLQNQMEILGGFMVSGTQSGEASSILDILTCIESQNGVDGINSCAQGANPMWKPVLDEHIALGLARVAVAKGQGPADAKWMAAAQAVVPRMAAEDYMSKNDMAPESKFLNYVFSGVAIDQAVAKTEQDAQDVLFR